MKNLQKVKLLIMLCTVILVSNSFIGTAHAGLFSDKTPRCTVSGKVTDQNHDPVEGATVVFSADGIGDQCKTVTDSLGNYVIHPILNSSGTLTIQKENYRITKETITAYYFSDLNHVYVCNYPIHPDWISGKIVNQNQIPLSGTTIMIEQNGGLAGVITVTTDENGNYRCTIPTDGEYYWITIKKAGYQVLREHSELFGGMVVNRALQ